MRLKGEAAEKGMWSHGMGSYPDANYQPRGSTHRGKDGQKVEDGNETAMGQGRGGYGVESTGVWWPDIYTTRTQLMLCRWLQDD